MQEARHGRFYIYVYVDVRPGHEGEVIYVGKGTYRRYDTFRRMESHWKKGPLKTNGLFVAVIDKIRKAGLEPVRKVISWHDEEHLAFEAESAAIAKYKLRRDGGTLCNLTQGGEGPVGMIHSEEAKSLISEASKEFWADPEYVEKVNSSRLATMATPAEKARKSQASVKNWSDPEFKAKTAAAIGAARRTEASRRKTSEKSAVVWADPDRRKAMSEHMKNVCSTPEGKARKSEAMRKMWAERKARLAAQQ